MKKTVIVINGRGGCGKDTICDLCGKIYPVINVSSITPIKEIARMAGWNGEKDAKSRKMLADLKELFKNYNDYPNKYVLNELDRFLKTDCRFLFVHIREADEIEKYVRDASLKCRTLTLLVKRKTDDYSDSALGNSSDDNVEDYTYDYTFINKASSLEELAEDVKDFFAKLIEKEEADDR